MLTELCKELRNWFDRDQPKFSGIFVILSGRIVEDGFIEAVQDGQYYRISGSVFNDGVYKHPYTEHVDEVFEGTISLMAVPKEVVDLAEEIDEWMDEYSETINSPYQSESFGGYTYSKASGGANGGTPTWKTTFASKLNKWRKI